MLTLIRSAYIDEFQFYSKFHQHPVNWTLHAITIPLEWCSWLVFLCMFNLEWITSVAIAAYYLLLKARMGTVCAMAHLCLAWLARHIYDQMDNWKEVLCFVAAVQVGAWFVQVVVGHRLFERNLPAMATKLSLHSVVLSVLLAWEH